MTFASCLIEMLQTAIFSAKNLPCQCWGSQFSILSCQNAKSEVEWVQFCINGISELIITLNE
jgi:hypothetical protein